MKKFKTFALIFALIALSALFACKNIDNRFVSHMINPEKQPITFYYKDGQQKRFGSIKNLKNNLLKQGLILKFAVNGGMYKPDHSPQGLFIENYKLITTLDTTSANGNFYLKPNGVFYITKDNKADISSTPKFLIADSIKYATQSRPMLLVNGMMHPAFKQGSPNVQIRNGVGILPDGRALFVMSKSEINFYDFADYFKNKGCKNALYLDGFMSRTYLPAEGWIQQDGDFGVIITVSE